MQNRDWLDSSDSDDEARSAGPRSATRPQNLDQQAGQSNTAVRLPSQQPITSGTALQHAQAGPSANSNQAPTVTPATAQQPDQEEPQAGTSRAALQQAHQLPPAQAGPSGNSNPAPTVTHAPAQQPDEEPQAGTSAAALQPPRRPLQSPERGSPNRGTLPSLFGKTFSHNIHWGK
jgi:hypothetical protein